MSEVETDPRVQVGGQARRLRLTPVAFRIAKETHGVQVRVQDLSAGNLGDVVQLLWIGLLVDDPALTESQVIGWLKDLSVDDEMALFGTVTVAAQRMYEGMQRALNPTTARPKK
jgi:hypothetical protein